MSHPRLLAFPVALGLMVTAWVTTLMAQTGAPLIPETAAMKLTRIYNAAMQAFQAGDYATAATNLESVAAQAGFGSDLEPVYFTLGASYFNLAEYPKAVSTLKMYRQKYPKSTRLADATFSIAQASLLDKDYATAATEFATLENVPVYREHALLYEATADKEGGHNDDAVTALTKLISPDIKTTVSMDGAMMLAGIYVDQKEADKAGALIGRIFQKADLVDNVIRLNALAVDLGDRLLDEQHEQEALAAYRNVRSRDEVIEAQAGRLASLQRSLRENLAAMKGNPAALVQLIPARNLIQAEIVKATAMLDEAKKLPEYAPQVLLREGRAWYDWGRKWESIVVFNRLLEKYPQAKERESVLFSDLTAYADVNQPELSRQLCEQYLKEYPRGASADTVGYLLGATAFQAQDMQAAATYFGRMLSLQPNSTFKEQMRFQLGNALFAQGKYDEAIKDYQQYETDFPNGQYTEEATYRIAASLVFSGKYEEAMGRLNDYLQRYPGGDSTAQGSDQGAFGSKRGSFAADAKYRLMVCKYAARQYDDVIADAASWQKQFPKNDLAAEVLSLLGDSLDAEGKVEEAIPAYVESYKRATGDEVMNYSLFQAAKEMQSLRKWEDVAQLFKDFVKAKPGSPAVVAAMSWIGRALSHEGKVDDAKSFLVDQLKTYIDDPKREAVEMLLDELVQLCSRRPRAAPVAVTAVAAVASPAPSAAIAQESPAATPPPYDAAAELEKRLQPLEGDENPTSKARLLYARASMDTTLRKPAAHDQLIGQIATQFKPGDLSPLLLAQAGDSLEAQGKPDLAAGFYNELKEYFPNSNYLDFAYVGLGEIAFAKKDYDTALELFTEAADKYAGSKEKDATIGEAKTLLELGRYDQSRKLFEQIATVREWRGESTAYAVYSMGDIERRQGHWAEAIAYYQRVFVLYQRYLPWVARSYVDCAESFDKLGKRQEAIAHLQEMLRNEKLQPLPEAAQARQLLEQWGAAA